MKVDQIELDVTGKFVKIVNVKDDMWLAKTPVEDIDEFIRKLKRAKQKLDIFTFCQKIPDTSPKYDYYMEWDNFAVIKITNYDEWWKNKLPQVTRKSVRRGYKKGVTVKVTEFNDELVKGIVNIHNERPIRQGRKFTHYGKDFDTVKKDHASYLSNSDFICAYYENELIGFIKLVYVGHIAQIMQIISMIKHQDKRTTNILIAKAVEICVEKKMDYFVYGKYVYGNKKESPIMVFKERNGFEMIKFPRYYIPLSLLGGIGIKLKIHNGMKHFIPERLLYFILNLRSKWYEKKYPEQNSEE